MQVCKLLTYSEILVDLQPFSIHPKIEKIRNELVFMLSEASLNKKEELACTVRSQLLQIEGDESFDVLNRKKLSKVVSNLLMRLAVDYPINSEDPISLTTMSTLPDEEVIRLDSGHQFHIPTLINFYNYEKRNLFSFINPLTMTNLPFLDAFKIIIKAKRLGLLLSTPTPDVSLVNNTVFFQQLISYFQEAPPEKIIKLVDSLMTVFRVLKDLQLHFQNMFYCYLLSVVVEWYFSLLHSAVEQPKKLNDDNASHFFFFNIFPSVAILSSMIHLMRNSHQPSESSQLRYFKNVFFLHFLSNYLCEVLSSDNYIDAYHETKFCIRYLFLWMILAQLIYPRSANQLQTYQDNLVSGICSLMFEILRNANFDAKKRYVDIGSSLFLNTWFLIPTLRSMIKIAVMFYEQFLTPNSLFVKSFEHILACIHEAQEAAHQSFGAPNEYSFNLPS